MGFKRTPTRLRRATTWLLIFVLVVPPRSLVGQSLPPRVVRHEVNGGSPQRSSVTNISLYFNTNVDVTASNLVLRNLATNAPINPTNFVISWDPSTNKASFGFPGLLGKTLPDGNYIASLLANTVTNESGLHLDGNADGQPGDAFTFSLFRYFGDWDGDRDVDFLDNHWLQRSFGKTSADTNFDARFDLNADNIVNDIERARFSSNYFTVLQPQPGIFAALVNDTGNSAWDNVTTDPTIAGTVIRTNAATLLEASFAGSTLHDLSQMVTTNGSFTLSSNTLSQILGSPLTNGPYTLHLQTVESNSVVSSTFDLPFLLESSISQCLFPDNLDGWAKFVGNVPTTWSNAVLGSVNASNCEVVLTEGDSFLVSISRTLELPTNAAALSFSYSMLSFDKGTSNKIKDAFEVALIDANGQPVTYAIGEGHDAFFNVTDGETAALADDVTISNPLQDVVTVTALLHSSSSGKNSKLILRLINNDQDQHTSVRVLGLSIKPAPPSILQTSPVTGLTSDTLAGSTNPLTPTTVQRTSFTPAGLFGPTVVTAASLPNSQFPIATNITVPPGFIAEVFAEVENPACLSVPPVGSEFGTDLYVATYHPGTTLANELIYRISKTGGVSIFTTLLPEADPGSLIFPPRGSVYGNYLYVSSNNRDGERPGDQGGTIQRIDLTGAVADFTPVGLPLGLGEPAGLAFGNGLGFGQDLYAANGSDPPGKIVKISPTGELSVFLNDGIFFPAKPVGLQPVHLVFSDGGDFGSELYFAEFDFNGNAANQLRKMTADGIVSDPILQLQGEPEGIRFSRGDIFGENLYIGVSGPTQVGGSILRVNTDGTSTTFASGFQRLIAESLVFDETRDKMYVADWAGNRIYRISKIAPPVLTIASPVPGVIFDGGAKVLVTGSARAQNTSSSGNSLSSVTVNRMPVDVLDANGNFFTQITIPSGQQIFEFVATDRFGQTTSSNLTLFGREPSLSQIDFENLSEISSSLQEEWGRTSFNEHDRILFADLSLRNMGQYPVKTPLVLGVAHISDPTVTVLNLDGITPEGIPFFDFSSLVENDLLRPDAGTGFRTLHFRVPGQTQFTFDLVVLGQLNQSPAFTSVPTVEVIAGHAYDYDAEAIDPDQDTVSYRLVSGPVGMSLNPTNGVVHWDSSSSDLGSKSVIFRAGDGHGGIAEQAYVLSVINPPPNRPPIITSLPVTEFRLSQSKQTIEFGTNIVIPYQGAGFEYKEVPFGDLPGFERIGFDNSVFLIGDESFGSGCCCPLQSQVRTRWNTGTDLLVRRSLFLPEGSRSLRIALTIDNDAQIFFNGSDVSHGFITHENCPSRGDFVLTVPDSLLVDGANLLAARARDRGAESYFEIQVTAETPSVFSAYLYDVEALDPDGDSLTYSLLNSPINMVIELFTGIVRWSPTVSQVGNHDVTIRVADGRGGVATQSYVVTVLPDPANHPPIIVSRPVTSTDPTAGYQYDVDAIDPENDQLIYSVTSGPSGLTINPQTGLVTWTNPVPAGPAFRLTSDFSTNADGWTANNGGEMKFVATGGDPGGYLEVTDTANSPDFAVLAPQRFLGDLSTFDGGQLSFDLRTISHLSGVCFDDAIPLTIESTSGIAAYTIPLAKSPDSWSKFSVPLNAATWGKTDKEWQRILSDVTQIRIEIEMWCSVDTSGFDNFSLIQRDGHPVTVQVDDNRGGLDTQSFMINVSPAGAGEIHGTVFNDQNSDGILDTIPSLYVSTETGESPILRYDANTGEFLNAFAFGGGDNADGDFAIGPDGNFYVAEWRNNKITRYSGKTGQSMGNFATGGDLRGVTRLVFGPDGNLYCDDNSIDGLSSTRSIMRYDGSTGAFKDHFVTNGSGGMLFPNVFIFGPDGNLYVSSSNPETKLLQFSGTTGAFVDVFVDWGPYLGNFGARYGSDGFVFGPDGNLYVSDWRPKDVNDSSGNRVLRFNSATHQLIDVFVTNDRLAGPQGLAFGPDGNLYIACSGSDRVVRVNGKTGVYIDDFIPAQSGGLEYPRILKFGPGLEGGHPDRVVYLDQNQNNRRDSGEAFVSADEKGRYSFGGLLPGEYSVRLESLPGWITTAPAGGAHMVRLFGTESVTNVDFGSRRATTNETAEIRGTIFNDLDGNGGPRRENLLVGAFGETLLYDLQSKRLQEYIIHDLDSFIPGGIAIGPDCQLYLLGNRAIYGPGNLSRFDFATGTFVDRFIPLGSNGLENPVSVLFAPDGTLLISSRGDVSNESILQCKILRFDGRTGAFLSVFSDVGREWNDRALDMAIGPDGFLYVGLQFTSRVIKFDLQTGVGKVFIPSGSGGADSVVGLGFGPDNNLYLVSRWTFNVLKYDGKTGQPLGIFIPQGLGGMSNPLKLTFDKSDNVYVNSFDTDTILQFNAKTGNYIDTIIRDSAEIPFDSPYYIKTVPAEPGLPNRVVYIDSNGNSKRDPEEQATITDDCGNFVFRNLPSGDYLVRHVIEPGWAQTFPETNNYLVRVNPGQISGNVDFGNTQPHDPTPPPIEGPNSSPYFTSVAPNPIVAVGQKFQYDAQASDPDQDRLRFDLVSRPFLDMAVHPTLGVLVINPVSSQIGVHQVVMRVQDGRGGVALQSFSVTVTGPNPIPVITSRPTGPALVGNRWQYQVRAQDADGDPITYSVPVGPAGMAINATNGLVLWTPTATDVGSQHVAISASDNLGATTTQSFDLPVVAANTNQPPTIASRPRASIRVGNLYQYAVHATDPNSDPLIYRLVTAPSGMRLDTAGLVTWTPSLTQLGTNSVELQVDDGQGGIVGQRFSVVVLVQLANQAPNITSTPKTAGIMGQLYAYDLLGIDLDNDPLAWALETAPTGMSIDSKAGTVRWTPTLAQLGTNFVVVRTTDGQGGFASQSYVITVRTVNLSPLITSVPPTKAATNQLYTYAVRAEDPEGELLSFGLTNSPLNMTIDSTNGIVQWTPTAGQLGTNSVTVRVTDPLQGLALQSYQIVVSTNAENHFPLITSTPLFATAVTSNYQYQVTATDADGDLLNFILLTGPTNMLINTNSGLITWTPSVSQLGVNQIVVVALDPSGAGGSQSFTISVAEWNSDPTITSAPNQFVLAGQLYRYDVRATDPDGDPLSYSLSGPAGMTIDQLGRVSWRTTITDSGTNRIAITVSDNHGASVIQTYDMRVFADTEPPAVHIAHGDNRLPVGTILEINAVATDNIGISSFIVTIGGGTVPLDSRGHAEVTLNQVGTFPVIARATDLAGNVGQDGFTLTIFQGTVDPNYPVVDITLPAEDAVITAPVNVVGTASDANLFNYKLEVRPVSGGAFTEIARGTNSVNNGVLGKLDPSTLANDSYELLLTATDTGGLSSEIKTTFSVAGELKLGNFRVSFVDLSIPVSGIPITVARTYDSLNANQTGDFGFGWRMEFREAQLRNNLPARTPEEIEFGMYPSFTDRTRVYVTLPGGRREAFTFHPVPISGFGGIFGYHKPAFVPDAGVTSALTVPAGPSVVLVRNDSGGWDAVTDGGLGAFPYNPDDPAFGGIYTVTTKDGIGYQIDAQNGKVSLIVDGNGNTLTFTQNSVVSSTGQQVLFGRDPQGRITSVTDPMGRSIHYGYDGRDDLISVTDRQTNTTQFAYNLNRLHYLEKITDPLGRSGVRTEYDDQGRLITLLDASGNPVHLLHDPDHSVEQVVDSLSHTNTFEYDSRGNVVTEINALGGVTRRAYDLANNIAMEVDPLGHTNLFTYDGSGNVLTRTDPLGNVTRNTYASIQPHGLFNFNGRTMTLLRSTTDPLGNTAINDYDDAGNLIASTDAALNVTRYSYDGTGNQIAIIDALVHTNRFEYDSVGHLLKQRDALGIETSFAYDANGNQLSQTSVVTVRPGVMRTNTISTTYDSNGRPDSNTDAAGNTSRTEYDPLGNTKATIDALGHRIEFRYSDRGQLTNTVFADGTSSSMTYDPAGRRITSTDRTGRTTSYEYDPVGRLITRIYPDETPGTLADNPRARTEYDLTGRVIAQIDERNNRTSFGYDDSGRQTSVTNALGHVTRGAYDPAGRKTADVDALGHVTQFAYDSLGRRTETVFADNTRKRTIYDVLSRVMAEVDQADVTNRFEYDAQGRLTNVVDALGHNTTYAYDEAGHLVRQQDANDHVTRFEHETCCQRSATILPLGQRSSTVFNAINSMAAITNFNGEVITYDYDLNNRLALKRLPDGSSVRYGYTPNGRRAAITNTLGVTTWIYDARDRLVRRTDPDGRFVQYEYDAGGNRTAIVTAVATNRFTFDALNRLETVTDPDGGVTTYKYDAVNNVVLMALPNGTFRTNSYDPLNRVTNIVHAGPIGVFSSFRYTIGPAGNRTFVQENSGRTVQYVYDQLYRLRRETIGNPTAASRTIDYTMDPVGNRLTRGDSVEGTTTYSYDDNDELLTEALGGLVTRYGYDNNGNTLSRSNAVESAFYNWSAENRLIAAKVTATNGVIRNLEYSYDDDGIRVGASVTEFGSTTKRAYLVDANRSFAQVLEQWDSLNSQPAILNTSYTYGPHHLISQNVVGIRSFFHADHLGSTRALTSRAGNVTDRYTFDVYGRLIEQLTALPQATQNNFLYAGEQRDPEMALDYLRSRYLNFAVGRLNSRDDFDARLFVPSTLHRFNYVGNNPENSTDPSGRFTSGDVLTTEIILETLALNALIIPNFKLALIKANNAADQIENKEIETFVAAHRFVPITQSEFDALDRQVRRRKSERNIFLHYSFDFNAIYYLGYGLVGSVFDPAYVTKDVYSTGWKAHCALALPSSDIQDAVYVVKPKDGFRATGPTTVSAGIDGAGRPLPGGGVEWRLFQGSGGTGTVFGPINLEQETTSACP
jgi:RHS repeat-associated protein